jgi:hypothetical protein
MALSIIVLSVLVALFILETILTEVEHFGWATTGLIVCLVLAQFFHLVDFIAFVRENTGVTLFYLGMYVVLGVAWSFAKWFSYLRNYRDQFREYKVKFLTSRKVPVTTNVPEDMLPAFKDWLGSTYRYHLGDVNLMGLQDLQRPKARENKQRIVSWMSLWPFSFVGTLLNDPVRRFFTWLFKAFSSLYQRMADWVFRNDPELK